MSTTDVAEVWVLLMLLLLLLLLLLLMVVVARRVKLRKSQTPLCSGEI